MLRRDPESTTKVSSTLFIACGVACVSGCIGSQVDIQGTDESVFTPQAKVSLDLNPWIRGTDDEHGSDSTTVSANLDFSTTRGEFSQQIASHEYIEIDDHRIGGSQIVNSEFSMYSGAATVHLGVILDEVIRVEGFGGLGIESLQLQLRPGNSSEERASTTTGGPIVGARVSWQSPWWVGAYAEGSLYAGVGGSSETNYVTVMSGELGLLLDIYGYVELFGGWRWREYDEDRSDSDIDLSLSGPTAGLMIKF